MQISAKADYAVRALLVLASQPDEQPMTGRAIAESQEMPVKFVENTLVELRNTGLVASRRGSGGGFMLAKPADQITIADVIRAIDGPLAEVRGQRPEATAYVGPAQHLQHVWIAVRANVRSILDHVTLADVVSGDLPADVGDLAKDPEAWHPRPLRP